ncbi:TcpD family membrane protein [Streptomyces sp. NPDC021100]|uniref:TcpD family membrane protein n=1 Tax=Streptomyces sp. NPDC021100 TaxID=3365114 RepID=UPI0037B30456
MLTGNDLKTAILTVVGNLFVAVLAVRAFGHWAKREWGAMVTHILGGAVVGFIIWEPQKAIEVLKFIGSKLTG